MPKTQRDASYSLAHCQERIKERYGLDLSEKEYNELNNKVRDFLKIHTDRGQGNDYALIFDVTKQKTATIYVIKIKSFKNKEIFVNYEDIRDCVTTILPPILRKPKSRLKK